MKKTATFFLALVMLLSLAACGGETTSTDVSADGNSTAKDVEQTTPLEEETTSGNEEAEAETEAADEITFTEMVAVENEECTIKITGVDADSMWGYTIKALLENKSADKTYMFSVENAAINGVQCDPFFATEVAAGKQSNEEIIFSDNDLEENGISEYSDIELTFRVYDSNDWSADAVAEETIHIYPYGEENAVKFVREAQDSDNVIIDNEYVTVVVTGYEDDDIWGYTVNLFLLNKTDKNIMFSVDEASINGFMADPFYAASVSAGNCAFSSMSWSDTTLEENSITEVESIEFIFRAYDEDNWFGDDFANETITLTP